MKHHDVPTIKPQIIQNQNVIHCLEHPCIRSGKTSHHWRFMSTRAAKQQKTYFRVVEVKFWPMAMTREQSASEANYLNTSSSCCISPM
uniref:Uncharacterized protein n=1 Tax=Vombatus ursinus TaxID=29139 RepID=A0A4X2KLN0_VOMUR